MSAKHEKFRLTRIIAIRVSLQPNGTPATNGVGCIQNHVTILLSKVFK